MYKCNHCDQDIKTLNLKYYSSVGPRPIVFNFQKCDDIPSEFTEIQAKNWYKFLRAFVPYEVFDSLKILFMEGGDGG